MFPCKKCNIRGGVTKKIRILGKLPNSEIKTTRKMKTTTKMMMTPNIKTFPKLRKAKNEDKLEMETT